MEKLIEALQQHSAQDPSAYGNAESVLDVLYWDYIEHGSPDSEKICNLFAELRKLMGMPSQEYDQVFYVVSDLCLEYGRLAFGEGVKIGIALFRELYG